jgi:hypothetical protein
VLHEAVEEARGAACHHRARAAPSRDAGLVAMGTDAAS